MSMIVNAEAVVQAAREWIGTPYVHQASLKGIGCDCLGLVRGVWRECEGIEPTITPRYSSIWTEGETDESLLNAGLRFFVSIPYGQACPADMLVFRMRPSAVAKHAGILTGAHSFVHAYSNSNVVESHLDNFWAPKIAGVFRFPSLYKAQLSEKFA